MRELEDLDAVWAFAEAAYPEEACGLGFAGPAGWRWVRIRNAATSPRSAFAFDEAEHLAALEAGDPVAVFHSHCDAPPAWSAADEAGARVAGLEVHPGAVQIVLSVRGGRRAGWAAYRLDPDSGRFDRVAAGGVPSGAW